MSFEIKQNDLLPPYRVQLLQDGAPFDLTGYTVTFVMRLPGAPSAKVSAAAVVIDEENGIVEYRWAAGNTDTVGAYKVVWKAVDGSGKPHTFPSKGTDYVLVDSTI